MHAKMHGQLIESCGCKTAQIIILPSLFEQLCDEGQTSLQISEHKYLLRLFKAEHQI